MDVNATSKQGYTPLDVALGKTVVGQLPVPHDSTVALIKKAGGKEGPGPQRGAKPPVPVGSAFRRTADVVSGFLTAVA